jgi:hypothetical protein
VPHPDSIHANPSNHHNLLNLIAGGVNDWHQEPGTLHVKVKKADSVLLKKIITNNNNSKDKNYERQYIRCIRND